ncbi:30S ribosomal protein S20 [Clostridium luticellarii]|jgi:small subunit ribosomal protein S20|uniref:Small ribosomal subunit protein bS20 n=1 Tax=Clostridium luticellarii TaxID=1691940 RepID=A0A2T0BM47_9CLOT|nr:30S ribosomal protein S20 [Clostridium luticellarii]MCI1944120.1 30S ribosomal protein S20 [Clostridium luticellarii]MCI1967238.1 30S ribosomal protein S20 [Clostridium luticellarii]MCI1995149.1 30S ribosomal protein S20 [Clostridium luticellarii]MCI2039355.1 30S ribosomal protein S20 [Clostridium luticellarii]PRR84923.1 30S ribosomal protein S20 [Clostridium luticellarii]
MANIKSAKKRIKVIQTKTLRNRIIKSSLKTAIKKFLVSIDNGNVEEAKVTFTAAVKAIDMAASKGVIHKNKASRDKSKLTLKLNGLTA